jgi:hypothetical protein
MPGAPQLPAPSCPQQGRMTPDDDGRWIVIPNWDEFQHYKDGRDPFWIKSYVKLLHKDEYMDLTFHQRGVLHGLWITYARSGRQLRDNTATLTRQLGHRVMRRDLEALNHAGFIQFQSRPSLSKSKSKSKTPISPNQKTCPECGVTPLGSLADHMANVHHQEIA